MTSCGEDEFTCDDGHCVSMEERCDSDLDCMDDSDEKVCRQIYVHEGYNKLSVPQPLTYQSKFQLNISLTIEKILSIDESQGQFEFKILCQGHGLILIYSILT